MSHDQHTLLGKYASTLHTGYQATPSSVSFDHSFYYYLNRFHHYCLHPITCWHSSPLEYLQAQFQTVALQKQLSYQYPFVRLNRNTVLQKAQGCAVEVPMCTCCKKDLRDSKYSSLHLALKYAWIFVLGHCLFLESQFSQRTLRFSEKIMSPDKYPSIFLHQMEAIVN